VTVHKLVGNCAVLEGSLLAALVAGYVAIVRIGVRSIVLGVLVRIVISLFSAFITAAVALVIVNVNVIANVHTVVASRVTYTVRKIVGRFSYFFANVAGIVTNAIVNVIGNESHLIANVAGVVTSIVVRMRSIVFGLGILVVVSFKSAVVAVGIAEVAVLVLGRSLIQALSVVAHRIASVIERMRNSSRCSAKVTVGVTFVGKSTLVVNDKSALSAHLVDIAIPFVRSIVVKINVAVIISSVAADFTLGSAVVLVYVAVLVLNLFGHIAVFAHVKTVCGFKIVTCVSLEGTACFITAGVTAVRIEVNDVSGLAANVTVSIAGVGNSLEILGFSVTAHNLNEIVLGYSVCGRSCLAEVNEVLVVNVSILGGSLVTAVVALKVAADVVPYVINFSFLTALVSVAGGVANVTVDVSGLSCETTFVEVALGVARMIEQVIGMLPFCNESHIRHDCHFIKAPIDSVIGPSHYLVAGALRSNGRNQFVAGFEFLGFNRDSGLRLERNLNGSEASGQAQSRQSDTQGKKQYSEKSLFHNSSFHIAHAKINICL